MILEASVMERSVSTAAFLSPLLATTILQAALSSRTSIIDFHRDILAFGLPQINHIYLLPLRRRKRCSLASKIYDTKRLKSLKKMMKGLRKM
jgi:hypothetical protein